MFAVSCIGVAFLVITLEFLRRISKDYEDSIQRQFQRHVAAQTDDVKYRFACGDTNTPMVMTFRASPLQQIVRSFIHMAQFAVAYIIMLIAMNYNGFMIISIFIGAFLGKLFCDWGQYKVVIGMQSNPSPKQAGPVGIENEPTSCCG
ncbi:hypothetical protein ASPWEDRAFT_41453 [Aspergillus wentii DTO 134E9]|uniref:Copper transport protein n=1 Tax=Aspergillus wentii DTO 134E9 TaxID=1073089 RepID=A0A1L9RMT7_ASPWE|nr:uncharacterized protein ASPWEDRAFT_41453 [Aspergillus wentii DTO 134E9]OJJ36246.1 hypothetical protein ASPWEDRAFT_41453 [Aspergillus wentii DTO 134E9]